MVDPWSDCDMETIAAAEAFCSPHVEYWVSVAGMVYPASCGDDAGMEALRQAGHNVWRTVDGRREE